MKVLVNWQARKDEFQYPLDPIPRTAVLVPWFGPARSAKGPVRVFRNGWCEETARFAPEAIAATWTQFRELAAGTHSAAKAPAPTHAVVVLHRQGAAPLTAENRDWLWRRFGVPVFEQMIGERGRLLAAECEAHEGVHVLMEPMNREQMKSDARVDASPCACGRKTPRLQRVQPPREPVAQSTKDSGGAPSANGNLRAAENPRAIEELKAVAAYAR